MPFDPSTHRFHDVIARVFGARGHVAGQSVLDDVMPVYEVNDKDDPSTLWSRGEVLWAWTGSQAAVAGQNGYLTLGVRPGFLATVQHLRIKTATAGQVNLAWNAGTGLAALPMQVLDSRAVAGTVATAAGAMLGATNTQVAAPAGVVLDDLPANTWVDLSWAMPLVLAPANTVGLPCALICVGAANSTVWFSVAGTYRVADEQELR